MHERHTNYTTLEAFGFILKPIERNNKLDGLETDNERKTVHKRFKFVHSARPPAEAVVERGSERERERKRGRAKGREKGGERKRGQYEEREEFSAAPWGLMLITSQNAEESIEKETKKRG